MTESWQDNIIPLNTNVVVAAQNRALGLKGWNSRRGPLHHYADRAIAVLALDNQKFELPPRTRTTFITAFSPDNRLIASCHGDHNTHILDVKTKKVVKSLSGHERSPWCVAFHPGIQDILATGSLNGEVRVWDLRADASESFTVDQEESVAIASLSFHPYDHVLAIAAGNEIHFWDWSLPQPFASVKTNNPEIEKVRLVRFDPWGHSIITGVGNPEDDEEDEPTFDHWSWLFAPSSRSRRSGNTEARTPGRRFMPRRFPTVILPDNSSLERTRGRSNPRQPGPTGGLAMRSYLRLGRRALAGRSTLDGILDRSSSADPASNNDDSDNWTRSDYRPPSRRTPRWRARRNAQVGHTTVLDSSTPADPAPENDDSDNLIRNDYRPPPRTDLSETHQRILHARVSVNAEIQQQYTRLQLLRQERQLLEMRLRELQNSTNEVRNSTPMLLNPDDIESPEPENDATNDNVERQRVRAPYERSINSSMRAREGLVRDMLERGDGEPQSGVNSVAEDVVVSVGRTPTFTELNNMRRSYYRPGRMMDFSVNQRNAENVDSSYSQPRIAPYVSFPRSFESYGPLSPESSLQTPAQRRAGIADRFRRLREDFLRNVRVTSSSTGQRGNYHGTFSTATTSGNVVSTSATRGTSAGLNSVTSSVVTSNRVPEHPSGRSENRLLSLAISAERVERDAEEQQNSDETMEIDISDVQSSVMLETGENSEQFIDFESATRSDPFAHANESDIQDPSSSFTEESNLLLPISGSSNSLRAVPTSYTRTDLESASTDQLGPDMTSEHESLRLLSRANLTRQVETSSNRIVPTSSSNIPTSLDEWLATASPDDDLFQLPSPPTPPTFQPDHGISMSDAANFNVMLDASSQNVSMLNMLNSTTSSVESDSTGRWSQIAHHAESMTSSVFHPSEESSDSPVLGSASSQSSTRGPSPVTSVEVLQLGSSQNVTTQSSENFTTANENSPLSTAQSLSAAVDSLVEATDSLNEAADTLLREAATSATNLLAEDDSSSPVGSPELFIDPVNLDSEGSATSQHVPIENSTITNTSHSSMETISNATTAARDSFFDRFSSRYRLPTYSEILSPSFTPYGRGQSTPTASGTSENQTTSTTATSGVSNSHLPPYGSEQRISNTSTLSMAPSSTNHNLPPYGHDYSTVVSARTSGLPMASAATSGVSTRMPGTSRMVRPIAVNARPSTSYRRGFNRDVRNWMALRSRGTVRRRNSESDSDDDSTPIPRLDLGSYGRNRDAIGATTLSNPPPLHRGQRSRTDASPSRLRPNPRSRTHRQLRRTRNIMRTSINRIISTVYAENNGHQAVVLNIDSATYRLQHWDFTRLKLPEISRSDTNILVPHCKIYNDASVDISRDGRFLAALVPTFVGFPDNMMNVAVFSLQPKTFGQLLFKKAYGPNAVCLSISPLCNHICVGLKSRQFLLGESRPNRYLMAQVLEMSSDPFCPAQMPVVRHICHPAQEHQTRLVSINTIAWSPEVGGGMVYGTNNGDLRMCSITPKEREIDDSDDNDVMS